MQHKITSKSHATQLRTYLHGESSHQQWCQTSCSQALQVWLTTSLCHSTMLWFFYLHLVPYSQALGKDGGCHQRCPCSNIMTLPEYIPTGHCNVWPELRGPWSCDVKNKNIMGALRWGPAHKKNLPNWGCIIFSHLVPFMTAHGFISLEFIQNAFSNSLKIVFICWQWPNCCSEFSKSYVVYPPLTPWVLTWILSLDFWGSPTHLLDLAASPTIWPSWWPTCGYLQDGFDLMALTQIRSGMTCYFTMHILLLISLSKDPNLVVPFKLKRKVPANPAMVILLPYQRCWRRNGA